MIVQEKWTWKMQWCKEHGLAPGNSRVWNMAEDAWLKKNIKEHR